MFDPDYMEVQTPCAACATCGSCAICNICLADGPIPDLEGTNAALVWSTFGVAAW